MTFSGTLSGPSGRTRTRVEEANSVSQQQQVSDPLAESSESTIRAVFLTMGSSRLERSAPQSTFVSGPGTRRRRRRLLRGLGPAPAGKQHESRHPCAVAKVAARATSSDAFLHAVSVHVHVARVAIQ